MPRRSALDVRKKVGALSTGYRLIYQLVIGLSPDVDYLPLDEPVLGPRREPSRAVPTLLLVRTTGEAAHRRTKSTHPIEEVANPC